MNDRPRPLPEGMQRALYALKHSGPLTRAEMDEYNAQRAREMARAEARRQPSPQLDLGEAA